MFIFSLKQPKYLFIFVYIYLSSFIIQSQSFNNVWIGNIGLFSNASLWSAGHVPGDPDYNVGILLNGSIVFIPSGNTYLNNIQLTLGNATSQTQTMLIINGGYFYSGTMTVNVGSTFEMRKNASKTGYTVDGGVLQLYGQLILRDGHFARNVISTGGRILVETDQLTSQVYYEYSLFDVLALSTVSVSPSTTFSVLRGMRVDNSTFQTDNANVTFDLVGIRPYTFSNEADLAISSSSLTILQQLVITNSSAFVLFNSTLLATPAYNIVVNDTSMLILEGSSLVSSSSDASLSASIVVSNTSRVIIRNTPSTTNRLVLRVSDGCYVSVINTTLLLSSDSSVGFSLAMSTTSTLTILMDGRLDANSTITAPTRLINGGSIGSLTSVSSMVFSNSLTLNSTTMKNTILVHIRDVATHSLLQVQGVFSFVPEDTILTIRVVNNVLNVPFTIMSIPSLQSTTPPTIPSTVRVYAYDPINISQVSTCYRYTLEFKQQSLVFTLTDKCPTDNSLSSGAIAGIVIPVVLVSLILIGSTVLYIRYRNNKHRNNNQLDKNGHAIKLTDSIA